MSSQHRVKCLLCDNTELNRQLMVEHYTISHNIKLNIKLLNFDNLTAFEAWKVDFEKQHLSKYVLVRSPRKSKLTECFYYKCHRDGNFRPKGNNVRRIKATGSNKINGCCPAEMKVTVAVGTGSVAVKLVETHVGHSNDISRITLSKKEREAIAVKMSSNVPFDTILYAANAGVNNVKTTRPLKKKDLYNIVRDLKINKTSAENGMILVDTDWVTENIEKGSVRLHKSRGNLLPSHPDLSLDDFILVISNEGQVSMLKQYGFDCVCLNGTRVHNEDYELSVLMVLNGSLRGFPCAFMFSNKTNQQFMETFVSVMRNVVGFTLAPSVLVCDPSPVYVNAWNAVMRPPARVLFSSSHVERTWMQHLVDLKFGEGKRKNILKTLAAILREKDEKAFSDSLSAALAKWESEPNTAGFIKYFKDAFGNNAQNWAHCYRQHFVDSIKITNSHLENMIFMLDYIYLEAKKAKKLDKCIMRLMKFTQDKLYDWELTQQDAKSAKKVADILLCHQKALKMKRLEIVQTEEGWSLVSPSGSVVYHVVANNLMCDCKLKCGDCNVCLHSYKCTCNDSAIRWNICCHIHFLAINQRLPRDSSAEPDYEVFEEYLVDEGSNNIENTIEIKFEHSEETRNEDPLVMEKKMLEMDFKRILGHIQTLEDAQHARLLLQEFIPSLEASRSKHRNYVLECRRPTKRSKNKLETHSQRR